jgi:muramoyltetrapeptide carboxypeptidase
MNIITPKKLQKGDKIKIIAPARSLSLLSEETIHTAVEKLRNLGLEVEFSQNSQEIDAFQSSAIQSRLDDLHNAFKDSTIKGILTVIGGFNSNQLLKHIDYDLIQKNPKILCGFSDITALSNAIYAKTGVITYSGMHFSSFGIVKENEFSIDYFCKCLMQEDKFYLQPSLNWSNDEWWFDQENRTFIENEGFKIINRGVKNNICGKILGGNLSTFSLLQGTEFAPQFEENTILFIEECSEQNIAQFDRLLQSIIHQNHFNKVQALGIGRFEKETQMTTQLLEQIIKSKKELQHITVIANMDFGHTSPMITFPIGGTCEITLEPELEIKITKH